MHVCYILHERHAHIFFHFEHSIQKFTSWERGWNQWGNLKSIKCWADIVEVFIDFIVVKVEGFKLGEVPKFQLFDIDL